MSKVFAERAVTRRGAGFFPIRDSGAGKPVVLRKKQLVAGVSPFHSKTYLIPEWRPFGPEGNRDR